LLALLKEEERRRCAWIDERERWGRCLFTACLWMLWFDLGYVYALVGGTFRSIRPVQDRLIKILVMSLDTPWHS
jgi:hypothetical protein